MGAFLVVQLSFVQESHSMSNGIRLSLAEKDWLLQSAAYWDVQIFLGNLLNGENFQGHGEKARELPHVCSSENGCSK